MLYSCKKKIEKERKTRLEVAFMKYSATPLIRINWEGEASGYAENSDNWFFFENRLHWQFINYYVILYSTYLRLNIWTTPDF
jgi:hypothetical protein